MAGGESRVSGGRGPLVLLGDDLNTPRREGLRDFQRLIRRAIIDDDDLFPCPRLGQGRLNRERQPLLRVVGRNQYRDQRVHETTPLTPSDALQICAKWLGAIPPQQELEAKERP